MMKQLLSWLKVCARKAHELGTHAAWVIIDIAVRVQ